MKKKGGGREGEGEQAKERERGKVHGPGYQAGVQTDILHPVLTEAHLKGKGPFFLQKKFPRLGKF